MIYLSTTFLGKKNSHLSDVFDNIENNQYDIDGIELGSTHLYQQNIKKYLINYNFKKKKILFHNFFPPIKNNKFVLNIASSNKKIRNKSVKIIKENILFAKKLDAKYYTIHPGFRSESIPNLNIKNNNYDFKFSKNVYDYENSFNNFLESFDIILKYSKKNNVKILLETEGSVHKYKFLLLQKPIEFFNLIDIYGNDINFNFNLSHTFLASRVFKFNIIALIKKINNRIKLIEISHNNKIDDSHQSLRINSHILKYLKYINCKNYILEFRNTDDYHIHKSINILRNL